VRRTPFVVAALVIGAVLTSAASCTSSDNGVTVGSVGRSTVTEVVDVPASVTARAAATLTAPADGTISALTVQPGATVAKGTVLAVVDSPQAQQRLADATDALNAADNVGASSTVDLVSLQSTIDSAEADALAAARAAADKVSDPDVRAALLAQVDASQKRYDAAAATSRRILGEVQQGIESLTDGLSALSQAQRAQAKAAYDLAKSNVDALTLRAPISGVVQLSGPAGSSGDSSLNQLLAGATGTGTDSSSGSTDQGLTGVDDVVALGDQVSAGQTIVTVVDVSEIGLVGEVDETDVLLVAAGVPADVELDAAPGQTYEAVVRTIDVLPTPSARGGVAYKVHLAFTDSTAANGGQAPPTPRPGMSAVAHLRVRSAVDAISVPASAVFSTDNGNAVWLVGSDGRLHQQAIVLGVQGEDVVAVTKGLQPGQRVVVTGTDKVSAGDKAP
jgi:multidrug efflux pump subunit AcrA (membrane-fusion protein)